MPRWHGVPPAGSASSFSQHAQEVTLYARIVDFLHAAGELLIWCNAASHVEGAHAQKENRAPPKWQGAVVDGRLDGDPRPPGAGLGRAYNRRFLRPQPTVASPSSKATAKVLGSGIVPLTCTLSTAHHHSKLPA